MLIRTFHLLRGRFLVGRNCCIHIRFRNLGRDVGLEPIYEASSHAYSSADFHPFCPAWTKTRTKSQDKDADKKQAVAAAAAGKKDQKKAAKDEKKEEPEKKGGMTADTFSGLKFRLIGPAVASGRVMSIAVNPKNKFEYYVGVASGGVWKTVNDGTTWTPVFDGEGSYSIGWVTLDPNNPSVVWVGSGESNSQRSVA